MLERPGTAFPDGRRTTPGIELRSALSQPEPGTAARALLDLAGKRPKPRRQGRPTHVSAHVKEYLYGRKA